MGPPLAWRRGAGRGPSVPAPLLPPAAWRQACAGRPRVLAQTQGVWPQCNPFSPGTRRKRARRGGPRKAEDSAEELCQHDALRRLHPEGGELRAPPLAGSRERNAQPPLGDRVLTADPEPGVPRAGGSRARRSSLVAGAAGGPEAPSLVCTGGLPAAWEAVSPFVGWPALRWSDGLPWKAAECCLDAGWFPPRAHPGSLVWCPPFLEGEGEQNSLCCGPGQPPGPASWSSSRALLAVGPAPACTRVSSWLPEAADASPPCLHCVPAPPSVCRLSWLSLGSSPAVPCAGPGRFRSSRSFSFESLGRARCWAGRREAGRCWPGCAAGRWCCRQACLPAGPGGAGKAGPLAPPRFLLSPDRQAKVGRDRAEKKKKILAERRKVLAIDH